MDIQTGRIHSNLDALRAAGVAADKAIEMVIPPTERQLKRGRVGRNEPCPCGSGKKFKQCHYSPDKR